MNYIIIKNTTATKVEDSVSQMVDLYTDTGFVNSVIINQVDAGHFLIEFPNQPDFERFSYFVNYLRYPEGFNNYNPLVYGIWNVLEPLDKISAANGEKLLIYISKFDKEYDNVIVENSKGDTYQYSFSGRIKETNRRENNYLELITIPENYTEHIEIVPTKEVTNRELKPWWKLW